LRVPEKALRGRTLEGPRKGPEGPNP